MLGELPLIPAHGSIYQHCATSGCTTAPEVRCCTIWIWRRWSDLTMAHIYVVSSAVIGIGLHTFVLPVESWYMVSRFVASGRSGLSHSRVVKLSVLQRLICSISTHGGHSMNSSTCMLCWPDDLSRGNGGCTAHGHNTLPAVHKQHCGS